MDENNIKTNTYLIGGSEGTTAQSDSNKYVWVGLPTRSARSWSGKIKRDGILEYFSPNVRIEDVGVGKVSQYYQISGGDSPDSVRCSWRKVHFTLSPGPRLHRAVAAASGGSREHYLEGLIYRMAQFTYPQWTKPTRFNYRCKTKGNIAFGLLISSCYPE